MATKLTEAAFMRMVLQLAKLHGWRVAHFRPAMNRRGQWQTAVQGDGAGFPDLLLLRDRHCMAVELKVGRNQTTPEQREWLLAFGMAGVPAMVWTERDWQEIETILRDGPVTLSPERT